MKRKKRERRKRAELKEGLGKAVHAKRDITQAPVGQTAVLAENNFYFQQRRGRLDLRSIARVDVERVIEDVDIDTLQSFLEPIAFSDLDVDDMSRHSDEHFVTLFRLSQLIIEYLLNVQNSLLTYAKDAESETEKLEAAAREGNRRLKSRKKAMESLRREIKLNRKTIATYEEVMKQKSAAHVQRVQSDVVDLGGRKFVAVDHIRAKAQGKSLDDDRAHGRAERARRLQDEERIAVAERARAEAEAERKKLELAALAAQHEAKLKAVLEAKEKEDAKLREELQRERELRQLAEQKAEAAQKEEQTVLANNQVEMEARFQEQIRRMKESMEKEMAEQRAFAQQQISNLEGKRGAPVPSSAGDLESDSEDEEGAIHDRVSWGAMRKSRKEMEALMKQKEAELEEARKLAEAAERKVQEEKEKREGLLELEREKAAKLAEEVQAQKSINEELAQEKDEAVNRSVALEESITEIQTMNSEGKTNEEPGLETVEAAEPVEAVEEETEKKTFYPMYDWKAVPANHVPFNAHQLDSRDGPPKEVKIPIIWQLNMSLEGGNNGSPASVDVQTRREMSVRQVLEDAASQLGVDADHLCLIYQRHEDGAEDFLNFNAGHRVDNAMTVESAGIFNRRPRLCRVGDVTEGDVLRFVESYEYAKENHSPFDDDVQDQMDLWDQKIMKSEKAKLALAKQLKPRPRQATQAAMHDGVTAQYDHGKGDIAAAVEAIKAQLIPDELVFNDLMDHDEDVPMYMLDEDFEELMEESWHVNKKKYAKTSTETVEDEVEKIVEANMKAHLAERKKKMHKKWTDMDSRMEALRTKHDAMIEAAVQSLNSRNKPMTKLERKVGIRNLFTKMHSLYFGKLLKPDIVSQADVINEQNLAEKQPGKRRKAAGIFGAASRALNAFGKKNKASSKAKIPQKKPAVKTPQRNPPAKSKSHTHHKKKTEEKVEFEESNDDSDEENEDTDDTEEDVGMNDSLKADLNSTMGSDIVEFGTLEIGNKADKYENENKPTEEPLSGTRDLKQEAEAEMIKVQGANLDVPDREEEPAVAMTPVRANKRERSSPLEDEFEDDSDEGSWDEDSMTLSPNPQKKQPNNREI
jgi:hypothetical protein